MRTLIICDDKWHPAQTVRDGLAPLDGGEFDFDWILDAGEWSAELMAAYPLVVLSKANMVAATIMEPWITPETDGALSEYVERGNGLVVIHSGTVGYDKTPLTRSLIGGAFERHPEQCPVTVEPAGGRDLTQGVEPFCLKDEHYFMALDDVHADVFLHSRSEHGVQPAGWTRRQGSGRVCVLTPGHNVDVWLHPSFQTQIYNALRWSAG